MTPEEEQHRFRIPDRDKLESQHAPKIERALKEQITAVIHDGLSDLEIASAPNRLDENSAELGAGLTAFAFAMSDVGIYAAQDDLIDYGLAVDIAEADIAGKEAARRNVNRAITQLNSTTRRALQAAIPAWLVQQNRDVDALLKELAPQMSEARAKNIATTEGTAIFSDGIEIVGAMVGAGEAQWYTMQDERVCPICRKMHGQRRPIGGQYSQELPVQTPPPSPHPVCRCGELIVIRSIGA